MSNNHQALFYSKIDNQRVQCHLCPHQCIINEGNSGFCRVRDNINGTLYAVSYGRISGLNSDPVEKKPLFHFHPGQQILSVGGYGCNFRCPFCQNHSISQMAVNDFPEQISYSPQQIIDLYYLEKNSCGIAFTYNEPIVNFEFVYDTAQLAFEQKIPFVLVTNGFINPAPFAQLLPFVSAMNIDLKAFADDFYRKYTGGRVAPILETIKTAYQNKIHIELTLLVIPTLNDKLGEFKLMVEWISNNLGVDVPLHLTRYFPRFKLALQPTPMETLTEMYSLAKDKLNHVYLGNVNLNEYQKTQCPNCYSTLVERNGYQIKLGNITAEGDCFFCGASSNIIL
ncbi:MAG TPA: AmmeMemoRadiSam system radical SAM enzyme [Salinivirgaceae bacterium]|nr:AmmeMemoRadiSam system radical SAM enzyme [Salinivirgaceae bacterium]